MYLLLAILLLMCGILSQYRWAHTTEPFLLNIMKWWGLETNNEVHKLFLQSLPFFICWNLWKNRCSIKYGGKQSSIARFKFTILKKINNLLLSAFPYLQWPHS